MAGGQHRFRCGVVPDPGGGGRDAAGAARFRQRHAGDTGHRADHLPGRAADQRLRRAPRPRHGFAHARCRFRLPRLDHHLADLRQLHLHLLCARGRCDGLRAGTGLRHPAGLGLWAVRAVGDSVGQPRCDGDQPSAGLDPTAVAGAAGAAAGLCAGQEPRRTGRPRCLRRCFGPIRWLRLDGLWRCADRWHRADHPDRRAGRLPAFHAREKAWPGLALVACRADGRAGLGDHGCRQDAGRRAVGLPGLGPQRTA